MAIIDDFPALSGSPTTGDELPIERGTATYKIDYDALATAIIAKIGTRNSGATTAAATKGRLGIGTAAQDFQVVSSGSAGQLYGGSAVVNNSANTDFNGKRVLLMLMNDGLLLWNSTDGASIWRMTTPVPITQGGTNATTASAARSNLGAVAHTDIVPASGTESIGTISAGGYGSVTVSIGTTLSSTNYIVITDVVTGNVTVGIQNKTTTTFDLYYRNVTGSDATGTVRWAIVMLP